MQLVLTPYTEMEISKDEALKKIIKPKWYYFREVEV